MNALVLIPGDTSTYHLPLPNKLNQLETSQRLLLIYEGWTRISEDTPLAKKMRKIYQAYEETGNLQSFFELVSKGAKIKEGLPFEEESDALKFLEIKIDEMHIALKLFEEAATKQMDHQSTMLRDMRFTTLISSKIKRMLHLDERLEGITEVVEVLKLIGYVGSVSLIYNLPNAAFGFAMRELKKVNESYVTLAQENYKSYVQKNPKCTEKEAVDEVMKIIKAHHEEHQEDIEILRNYFLSEQLVDDVAPEIVDSVKSTLQIPGKIYEACVRNSKKPISIPSNSYNSYGELGCPGPDFVGCTLF
jgi:hypothetical protein